MKKLFTLLTLLVLCVTGVWAEDETIFSASPLQSLDATFNVAASSTQEITSSYATISGGKITASNTDTKAYDFIAKSSNYWAFLIAGSKAGLKVELNKAIAEGDIISAEVLTNGSGTSNDRGIYVCTNTSRPGSDPNCTLIGHSDTGKEFASASYKVKSTDDICGKKTIYIWRKTGNSTYFKNFVITHPIDNRTAVIFSFPSDSYNANLGESFSAPTLTVAPAAASSEVAYTSSNTDVATVNPSTGAIALVAAGKTTITAAISESATYKDASASYELTVVDPNAINVSTTWTMADGAESVGVPGADETVMKTDWSLGNNMFIDDTPTYAYPTTSSVPNEDRVTLTRFIPSKKVSNKTDGHYVEWYMKPWKGLIFTPTNVSLVGYKCGTGSGNITVVLVDGSGKEIELKSGQALTRDNQAASNADATYSYDVTGAAASANAVKLRVYIYNIDAGNKKQAAIGNVVITGTASGTAEELASYTVTTSMNINGAGTVSPLLGEKTVYETNDIKLTATANTGYKFVNWTIDGNTQAANPYTISNVNENHTAVANFKQLKSVTFAAGDGVGEVPATAYADEGDTYTVPKSYYLAKSGYTLVGWNNGTSTYKAGDTFTMPAENVTLTAVFEENTEALSFSLASTTVTWDFQQKTIGEFTSATSGTFVAQATVNEKTIDVPMTFDKQIPNASWTDWANLGNKPTLTIPAVKGMQITLLTHTSPSTTTIAGATNYDVTGENAPYTVKYTYTGSAETVDIALTDGSYIRSVKVTYPKTHTYVDVTDAGYRTFASSSALDFTKAIEGLKAYKATVDGKTVKFETIDCAVPASTGMLLKAAEGRYYIPLASGTPDAIVTALVGVTDETPMTEPIFVLMDGAQGVGFYKTGANFTVGHNTAYLPANVVTGARMFIGFDEEGEATGIEAIERNQMKDSFYNLNGQRVAAPQKGLYIVNGKKVVLK